MKNEYLAAIRHHHVEIGYESTISSIAWLRLLIRAIKGVKSISVRPKRVPIPMDLLRSLKKNLRKTPHLDADKLMLWAAFTTAFFGFLRSSEFCSMSRNSFVPDCTPLVRDISCVGTNVFLFLKTSKTDPFRD